MNNKYIKAEYDSEKTILRCDQCGHEKTEWYNDQPGDECLKPNCSGRMVRVLKSNQFFSEKNSADIQINPLGVFTHCCPDCSIGQLIEHSQPMSGEHYLISSPVIEGRLYYYRCNNCSGCYGTIDTYLRTADSFMHYLPSLSQLILSLSISVSEAILFMWWIDRCNLQYRIETGGEYQFIKIGVWWYVATGKAKGDYHFLSEKSLYRAFLQNRRLNPNYKLHFDN